jgi:hypothetical protein
MTFAIFSLYQTFSELTDIKKVTRSTVKDYKKEFYSLVDNLIVSQDSTLINIETIRKIFNSLDRKSDGVLFKYGFINTLEDYSVYLINDTINRNDENFKLAVTLIESELKEEPFNQLPSEQRRVLLNLRNSILNLDKENGIFNLNELNDLLRIQNENYESVKRQNAWSIPLAIAGLILTLFFGIISFVKSVTNRNTPANNV